jgi:phage repressor protein C with HTH and peptisase S24 domain
MIARAYAFLHTGYMNQLQRNLIHLMKLSNHNPNSLAEATGAKQPSIFRILEGESADPRTSTLKPIAAFYGVSVSDLREKDLVKEIGPDNLSAHEVREEGASYGAGIVVPVMDATGSMGNGRYAPENDAIVGGVTMDPDWIRRNLTVTAPINLAIVSGYGNSMEPTYRDGDLLLVDRGVTSVKVDAVYVFTQNNELFIKTLQRRPDGTVRAISDNKTYDPWEIDAEDQSFKVLARVVWAWNGKKL